MYISKHFSNSACTYFPLKESYIDNKMENKETSNVLIQMAEILSLGCAFTKTFLNLPSNIGFKL